MFGSEVEPVKALRESLDDLAHLDLERLFDDQVTTLVVELTRLRTRLDAAHLAAVAELDGRSVAVDEGHSSTSAWLAHRCKVSWGQARGDVALARSLQAMPGTTAAMRHGDLDVVRVRRLAAAATDHPEVFARDETILLDAATTLTPRDLVRVIEYWRQAADREHFAADEAARYRRRRLHISETFNAMVRIDGDLDPESGHTVATALRPLTEPAARDGDHRSAAQRRADALVEISRYYLDHAATPLHGGEKPHLTVVVDLAALTGEDTGRCHLGDGQVITAEAARRIACDAALTRVITNGPSHILDVGRSTRTVPPATRKALDIRDGHCTWAGCHRPPPWCDAQRIIHWAHGGPTDLDNLTLLCRHHHRLAHHQRRAPP